MGEKEIERLTMKLAEYRRELEEVTGLSFTEFTPGYNIPPVHGKRSYSLGIRRALYPENSSTPVSFAETVVNFWETEGYEYTIMGSEDLGEMTCIIPEVGELTFGYGPAGVVVKGVTNPI
jgi:hypothetical protein